MTMLTELQKLDILQCYKKGLTELETLNFIMMKYCKCELPAYKPKETVYNYILEYYKVHKKNQ